MRCPHDADDFSGDTAIELDPIADAARIVELQRDPAEEVAQRGLHRKRDGGPRHCSGCDEAGRVHSDRVEADQGVHDQRQGHGHFAKDARHRTTRQEHAGHERDEEANIADRDDQQADLARNHRDGQMRRKELKRAKGKPPSPSTMMNA